MKRIKKVISVGLLLLIACSLSACKPDYALDCVDVAILEEYRNDVNTGEITAEYFNFENVDYVTIIADGSYMVVYLKKHGKKYVEEAIEHFNTLEFVEFARLMYWAELWV